MLGDVGGIVSAFISSAFAIAWTLAKIDFQLEAIDILFEIKNVQNLKLKLNICQKISLLTNICPNKTYKKLLKLGQPLLYQELDMVKLIKGFNEVAKRQIVIDLDQSDNDESNDAKIDSKNKPV